MEWNCWIANSVRCGIFLFTFIENVCAHSCVYSLVNKLVSRMFNNNQLFNEIYFYLPYFPDNFFPLVGQLKKIAITLIFNRIIAF